MSKKLKDIKSLLVPSDAVTVFTFVFGVLIAVYIDEIAFKLIGISISILALVALFMMISQRMSSQVDRKYSYKNSDKPEFKITVKKTENATSQVFEVPQTEFEEAEQELKEIEYQSALKSEEGFRIVKKFSVPSSQVRSRQAVAPPPFQADAVPNLTGGGDISESHADKHEEKTPVAPTKKMVFGDDLPPETATSLPGLSNDGIEAVEAPEIKEESPYSAVQAAPSQSDFISLEVNIPIQHLLDEEEHFNDQPRKEFEYLTGFILSAVRSISNTQTAAFILLNAEKQEMKLEAFVTSKPEVIKQKARMKLGNDFLSRIVQNQKPEILSEINPAAETDLIPYHSSAAGSLSFIGLPVFYKGSVIGVLCADSDMNDAYDSVTVGFLVNFTRLISGLIMSYIKKYDLMQDSKTLSAFKTFQSYGRNIESSPQDIFPALIETISGITDADTIGICSYSEESARWHVSYLSTKSESNSILLGAPVDLENSFVGSSVLHGEIIYERNPELMNLNRVSAVEMQSGGRYIISLPLMAPSAVYGALFLEGDAADIPTGNDVEVIQTVVNHSSSVLEKIQLVDLLESTAMYDPYTGLMNRRAFIERLGQETGKCIDFDLRSVVIMFSIDKYKTTESDSGVLQSIAAHVTAIMRKHMRKYDFMGQVDADTYVLFLTGYDSDKGKMWCERVRSEVAVNPVAIDNKNYASTVSLGLYEVIRPESTDIILDSCRAALTISNQRTNAVTVFS